MARIFSGSGQWMKSSSVVPTTRPISISAWVYMDALPVSADWALVAIENTSGGAQYVGIAITSQAGGRYIAQIQDSSGSHNATATGTAADTWQHVLGVFGPNDPNNIECIRDDTASGSVTSTRAPTLQRIVLANVRETNVYPGVLAEVTIWNVVLNAKDRTALAAGIPSRLIQPQNIQHYIPLIGADNSNEWDQFGRETLTQTGGVQQYDFNDYSTYDIGLPIYVPPTISVQGVYATAAGNNVPLFAHSYRRRRTN